MELLGLLILIVFFLVGLYLKSPTVRGARGENKVIGKLESRLQGDEYKIFNDVTLDSSRGATQIDHIVVSRYGVFVIETKNYSGWIFGDAKSKQWTQVLYRKKYRFMNPLRQNYKHVKAVKSFLSLDSSVVYSVVVFVGKATFKTDLPSNVIYLQELYPVHPIKERSRLKWSKGRFRDHAANRSSIGNNSRRSGATPFGRII